MTWHTLDRIQIFICSILAMCSIVEFLEGYNEVNYNKLIIGIIGLVLSACGISFHRWCIKHKL